MDFLYVSSHWQLILLALSQISWLKRSLTWGFQHKVVMMSHSLPAREDPSGRWWYSQRRWSPSSGWRWSRCRTRWWPPRRCTCPCRPPAQHTWFISRSGRSFDFYKQCREENARETSCQNNLSHLSDNKLSVTFVTLNLGTDFPLGTLYFYIYAVYCTLQPISIWHPNGDETSYVKLIGWFTWLNEVEV